ncbi:MAG TPA: malectin domain-containing carbohydrate-binding protein, partial [Planctomycetota bacterium]|nr:malectin domain-containing carbohydrate-binding protein [Planctomycetota bacterium]
AVAIYGGPTATIHDAATGQRLASLTGHTHFPSAAVFSPDSQRILTVSRDHTARIWSSTTGEEIFTLQGHVAPVILGSFSRDGSRVLTASEDQSVRVWDAVSGKQVMTLPHPEAIQGAAFTEEGNGVATVSGAAEGRIWPLDLLPPARRRMSREITPEEMDRYEIGTPEERLAHRRQGELNALFEEIDVAAARFQSRKRPVPGGLESLSSKLERLLRDERGDARLEKAIASLEGAVERTGRRDPGLLGLLASCEALRGDVWKAVVTIEETLDIPGSDPGLTLALERHRKALRPDIVSFASIDAALDQPEIVIPQGAEWKFFRGRTEPSRALEWTAPGFDDTAWEKGPSGLGYGDNDDATLIEDMKGHYTTLYVRHAFEVSDPAGFEAFRLSVIVDDGLVAYLNGAEIARLRAGRTGTRIRFDGIADRHAEEPVAAMDWVLKPELLAAGRNVLAIQVLNRSIFSSDLSIIPILRGVRRSGPEEDRRRLESFRQVAKGDDAPLRVLHFEGRILERAGKHREAAAKLEEVLRARPGTPEPLLQAARNLQSAGDPGAAAVRLREGIQAGLKQSAAIWDLWILLTFGELKADFEMVSAGWPLPRQGNLHPRGEDLRWVVDQLATQKAIRMRCGSKEYRSRSGTLWSPDRFFTGGMLSSSTLSIKGTDDEALYQSERWFPGEEDLLPGYHVPLPPGRYRVALHFAEVVDRSGRRKFHILIEGVQVVTGYEPHRAGFASADIKSFETTVKDGVLDIELDRQDGNPKVSAIEIEYLGRE